jgi:hypothetical protein
MTSWSNPAATDICHAAKLIIDRHGNNAAIYAAARTAVLASCQLPSWMAPVRWCL